MTTLKVLLLAAGAIASLVEAGPARAALVQVSSLSGTALTFGDAPGTTYAAGKPISYGSPGQQSVTFTGIGNALERDQANNSYLDSNYADGTQLIGPCGFAACNPAGSLTLAFSGPVLGFSLAADDFDTTQSYTFQASVFSGQTLLGTITASSLADNGASPAILAATSTLPITSISLSDGGGSGAFVVGNIATVPAPEPWSLALLTTGLVSVAGLRRRWRSRV